jgi:hypothetical protein
MEVNMEVNMDVGKLTCSRCNKKLSLDEDFTVISVAGGVKNYCSDCQLEKTTRFEAAIPMPPIITIQNMTFLVFAFVAAFMILHLDGMFFVSACIYLSIGIDISKIVLEILNRKKESKINQHYKKYGSYNTTTRGVRNETTSMIFNQLDELENVDHLLRQIKDQKNKKTSWFAVIFYDIKIFCINVFNVLEYFRLTLYALMYAGIVLALMSIMLFIQKLLIN